MNSKVVTTVITVGLVFSNLQYSSAQTQTGAELIKKMQAAYAGLKSYSQKTSATGKVTIQGNAKLNGMTAEFRYQSPNKAFVLVSSPTTGALACFSNGRDFTVYQSTDNVYTKLPAVSDLQGFVKALAPFSIAATLDPLYFAEKLTLKDLISSWQLKPSVKINGVNCQVVQGHLIKKLLIGGTFATVTYWIDDQYFIRKLSIEWKGIPIQIRSSQPSTKGKQKASPTVLMDRTITEVVQDLKINPPLTDADFTYPVPKNAREIKASTPK